MSARSSVETWCFVALLYISLADLAGPSFRTNTIPAAQTIHARAIVQTWIRLTLVDIFLTVFSSETFCASTTVPRLRLNRATGTTILTRR